jgi:DNA-binding NtrC family response regulator
VKDKRERILVLDDDAGVVDWLRDELQEEGYSVAGCRAPREALDRVRDEAYDLILSDVEMPEMRGLEFLSAVHALKPEQLVLLMTAFGSIDLAVQAVRSGACDFVTKPFTIEVLRLAIERVFRERQMRREIIRLRRSLPETAAHALVAKSAAMRKVIDLAQRAALSEATVLLTGDSGTGKGAVARRIHDGGSRAAAPFLQLNCAALPSTLVESELFGARRGAYTDARQDRAGLFAAASGGTLFLDEVGELTPDTQAKLLHVLESGRVRPVGATAEIAVNTRVVAATNQPLETLLSERRFRPDLYYRLNVIRIEIPPLRERRDDILPLVDHFLQGACTRLTRNIRGVSAPALRLLMQHDWPGNVRELANLIERAVAMTDYDTITPDDLMMLRSEDGLARMLRDASARTLPLADLSRAYARSVVEAHGGNKAKAARALGIDRRTLYRML